MGSCMSAKKKPVKAVYGDLKSYDKHEGDFDSVQKAIYSEN